MAPDSQIVTIAALPALIYAFLMISCDTCVVRNRAICSVLDHDELTVFSQIGRGVNLKKGQILIWEGDKSLIIANLVAGYLKLSSSTDDGREQIISITYPADFVGRPFGIKNEYTVTALTDARLCVFSSSDFDQFARQHPNMEHKLLEKTLDELDRARRWMKRLGRKTAQEKMASFLLEMSDKMAGAGCDPFSRQMDSFELPFGRQQIADILGLTVETVSRQLTQFTDDGLISIPDRRHIHIADMKELKRLSDT